eukprot:4528618-Prymnesium_polylepis.1
MMLTLMLVTMLVVTVVVSTMLTLLTTGVSHTTLMVDTLLWQTWFSFPCRPQLHQSGLAADVAHEPGASGAGQAEGKLSAAAPRPRLEGARLQAASERVRERR